MENRLQKADTFLLRDAVSKRGIGLCCHHASFCWSVTSRIGLNIGLRWQKYGR